MSTWVNALDVREYTDSPIWIIEDNDTGDECCNVECKHNEINWDLHKPGCQCYTCSYSIIWTLTDMMYWSRRMGWSYHHGR